MAEVLLSSETFVKSVTNISDNMSGKYILSSLREAQDIHLKSILGESLLAKLKELIKVGKIDEQDNAMYKNLVNKCQYYLAYMTIVEIVYKVSYKIGNAGVVKATDESMQSASLAEIAAQKEYYQSKADYYCLELQNFLLENRSAFPELSECDCHKIHANLHSAATCGFFLGGARGKRRGGY
jgi:hypothetical protein